MNENEFIFRFNHELGIVQFSIGNDRWYKVQATPGEIKALLGLEEMVKIQLGSNEVANNGR